MRQNFISAVSLPRKAVRGVGRGERTTHLDDELATRQNDDVFANIHLLIFECKPLGDRVELGQNPLARSVRYDV